MTRQLDTATLDAAARYYASLFVANAGARNRAFVMGEFYKFRYKDEHNWLRTHINAYLGPNDQSDFDTLARQVLAPREDQVYADLLAEHLAIDPDGNHLDGKIGKVEVGRRTVGRRVTRHGILPATWPIYAGEDIERRAQRVRAKGMGGPGADPLPPPDTIWPGEMLHVGIDELYALNTNVSVAAAIAGLDAIVDLLDEGTLGAVMKGYTTAQPVDPDAAIGAQTLLFTLTCSTTAFGNASDDTPGAIAAAAAITDDSVADDTGTLAFIRASSSSVADTALNDHVDGEAGTATADFIFPTLAIVAAATVSMTSWDMTLGQGPTAT